MKILIIGGNNFFGKQLANLLITQEHDLTLINRGNLDDGFGNQVSRIQCDRNNTERMKSLLKDTSWDVVFDQICYDYTTAKNSCDIFKNRVKHYIFTSSKSVYGTGSNIKEDMFAPEQHHFTQEETWQTNYAEAKRQAENAFTLFATFPVTFVRFPIVIGNDDYTQRFDFHINRIKNQKEIYINNLNAHISFISSEDAARSLAHIADKKIVGAINCCNDESIQLKNLIQLIEEHAKTKAVLSSTKSSDNTSPYNLDNDWYLDSSKLKASGLKLISVEKMIHNTLNSRKSY